MRTVFLVLALLILFGGAILNIVGLATPEWSLYEFENEEGPFRYCKIGICGEQRGGKGSIDGVRAMVIIGMILSVFAWICNLVLLLDKPHYAHMPHAVLILCGLSFLSILIGIIVWGAGYHGDISDHQRAYGRALPVIGYSFILSLVGGVMIMVAGLLAYVGGRHGNRYD